MTRQDTGRTGYQTDGSEADGQPQEKAAPPLLQIQLPGARAAYIRLRDGNDPAELAVVACERREKASPSGAGWSAWPGKSELRQRGGRVRFNEEGWRRRRVPPWSSSGCGGRGGSPSSRKPTGENCPGGMVRCRPFITRDEEQLSSISGLHLGPPRCMAPHFRSQTDSHGNVAASESQITND
jgi:hypothetical protein